MSPSEATWFIVKDPAGHCEILSEQMLAEKNEAPSESKPSESKPSESKPSESKQPESEPLEAEIETLQQWGPFETQNQAIAKRVGLIRAGKCQPVS